MRILAAALLVVLAGAARVQALPADAAQGDRVARWRERLTAAQEEWREAERSFAVVRDESVVVAGEKVQSPQFHDAEQRLRKAANGLRLLRNEVFAWHGKVFRSEDLNRYFIEKLPGYRPDPGFRESGMDKGEWTLVDEAIGFERSSSRPDMEFVRAGEFLMGEGMYTNLTESDSRPSFPHKVFVSSFFMDRQTASARDFDDFCKATGKVDWRPERIVGGHAYMRWDQAAAFCRWKGKRLPTEAEWERYGRISGVSDWNRKGVDVEWCSDWYDPGYYQASPNLDPRGPATGKDHVVRAGPIQLHQPPEDSSRCRCAGD